MWLWSTPEASRALRSRNLGVVLRTYRRINRLSQERLAALLGYDKTYISMIETRRRVISDVATLRHIAHTLTIPCTRSRSANPTTPHTRPWSSSPTRS